ncbi:MAG: phosphoenolpyruvate synthase [Bacteroidales bacterium]|nr:phosphoenolpyruvate synthase [Bacteroidales bacterium]MCF8406179.1 phosphoenolpyruvate synthase [Bacteroidales bacterium]
MTKVNPLKAPKYYFSDTSFSTLMKKRIYHVLLVSSSYDAFMLEDDGRIDEQIFNEYVSLNLRYPPQFILANSEQEAFEKLNTENIDLVITMLSAAEKDTFDLAQAIKAKFSDIPIVVLTPFSRKVTIKVDKSDLSAIDYIFSWLGNADILLAIIKLIEDKMNLEHDVFEVGVQTILLVEDSIRFYSSYLPNIYKIIFKQSLKFVTEGLNEHQKMLRMRGRPKIILATTFEDAVSYYEKYKHNMLGVITDMTYERQGKPDKYAGIKLCERIKKDDKFMPLLLQSSDAESENLAKKTKVGFINKHSKTLSLELRNFIFEYFAFGDFVFINPSDGTEILRASDLKSFQDVLFRVPDDSLEYHITRNHFSKWFRARALFPLADLIRDLRFQDFHDLDDVRKFMFDAIVSFRINKARGVIAEFYRERFDEYFTFTRIGDGSIGGKARGLAFLDSLITRNKILDKYTDVVVTIPRSVVLCTDIFDEFMEENNLYSVALADQITDQEILDRFLSARLPFRIHEDLYTFISVINKPIAVRSSSLLEDSHYQPFAGIYSTYMIPYVANDERLMIEMLSESIKCVYASAFFKDSKAYMAATLNVIDEEKMGIVLQEVCGEKYDDHFYPSFSGVARSYNFYPIEPEKTEDGIANIALGLGKYIVDGGITLRFSPKYPKKVMQLTSPEMALRETQRIFYALDLNALHFKPSLDDGANLKKYRISQAEKDKSISNIASTYDYNNQMLRDGVMYEGKKVITFANILQNNTFPLAEILDLTLKIGQKEMNKPVEIEFAVNLSKRKAEPHIFNILQIRPIVDNKEDVDIDLGKVKKEDSVIISNSALGNGIIENIYDLVYVKPESFNPAHSLSIAEQVGILNDEFLKHEKSYILIGPGRWGSTDPWLGIPVKWPQISAARVIVESGLENYRIDPSQGTHFFQNLTSFRVGYFTINPFINDGYYDLDFLSNFNTEFENEFIRHIRFSNPLIVKIDGRKGKGVIYKPVI